MQPDENLRFLLLAIVATSGMLLLGIGVILFVVFHNRKMMRAKINLQEVERDYQNKLLNSVIESQEKERERIARDLHDDVGGSLSAIKLNIGLLLKNKDHNIDEALDHAKELIDNTADSVRQISMDLLPVTLNRLGLSSSIRSLCSNATNTYTKVSFEENGKQHRLFKQQELGVYRICQELVFNALKHANATNINVSLNWSDNSLDLSVKDNGVGFDSNLNRDINGLGLDNINSRVRIINADFSIDSKPSQGTNALLQLAI